MSATCGERKRKYAQQNRSHGAFDPRSGTAQDRQRDRGDVLHPGRGPGLQDPGRRDETDFIDIVAWRGTAEFVFKYLSKGRMAVVEGRLQIRNWTDKDGGKRRSAEVIADNVYFGDSKRNVSELGTQSESPAQDGGFQELGEDEGGELPF